MIDVVTIGTRTSPLAMWQSEHVASLLASAWTGLHTSLKQYVTLGDKTLDRPLPEIGGRGLFTSELEQALLAGEIDLAVHSLKDLPIEQPVGLTIGAVVGRADVRDCLIAKNNWSLESLPPGAVLGTSSTRRRAQIGAVRPDLEIRAVRGNVETRIRKVMEGDYDAVVLAAAGISRLGLEAFVAQWLPLSIMLPAPGQGALAVQCRAGDEGVLSLLSAIDDGSTRTATNAERRFLQLMGGGCAAPVAAYAERQVDGQFSMAVFARLGSGLDVWEKDTGPNPEALASELAARVLGHKSSSLAPRPPSAPECPLAGKRIVVTRARHQAQQLVERLEKLGAEVVSAPAIEIEPSAGRSVLERALRELDQYRWVVFTSVNAVEGFCDVLDGTRAGLAWPPHCQIAAVGPSTERALIDRGLPAAFVPEQYLGEALAHALHITPGDRVLLPRGSAASVELPAILRQQGALVDDIEIYDTRPAELDAGLRAALALPVDAVLFASASAARNFAAAIEGAPGLQDLLDRCAIVCIGPKTADAVRALGRHPAAVADTFTEDGLIEALITHLRGI